MDEMVKEQDRVLDTAGNLVEGLPATYDNIDEQGNVRYLDDERRARKEQPEKAMYTNHRNGLGIKNFLVTHLSARDWNWNVILAVFRKIVAWSVSMKHPETMRSKLYKKGMLFEPRDKTYSTGSIYNLNVDADQVGPGTAAYNGYPSIPGHDGAEPHLPPVKAGFKVESAARAEHEHHHEHELGESDAFACRSEGTTKTIEIGKVVSKDVESDFRSVVVPMDLVKKAISEAKYIGGMKECLCRAGNDCKNYPHDVACLFLNMGGKVVVEHGMAIELTKEEAYARVDRAAQLGLVCQSLWVEIEQLIWGFRNDEMNAFLEICFCCPCCCVGFNLSKNATRDVKHRFSPSGWTAVVDHDKCIGCQACLGDYCPQDAIHFRESDGKMVVDQENCVGCGFCRTRCEAGAISIKQTMPMRGDVHEYFTEEGRLNIVPGPAFADREKKPLDGIVESATMTATKVIADATVAVGGTAVAKAHSLTDKATGLVDKAEGVVEVADGVKKDIEEKKTGEN